MIRNNFAFTYISFLLSACFMTPEEMRSAQLNQYRTRCSEYGFSIGTAEFAQCMEKQEKHDEFLEIERKKLNELRFQNQQFQNQKKKN